MSARLTLLLISGIWLSSCATQSLPSNFVYETSLRTEQGFIGSANRKASAEALLSGGVVSDPNISLQAALPDAEVKVRRWGLVYLSKNWKRYQAVLDADITQGDEKTKCRMSAPESLEAAPTLAEMRAGEGVELQRLLSNLIMACAAQASPK
jgi:hypothetical protein